MHHLTLAQYLSSWEHFAYAIGFLGMIVEGEAILFTAAFLANQGAFNPIFIFGVLFAGVITGDLFWYWLGLRLQTSNSFVKRWAERIGKPFDRHLVHRQFRTIFISKFTYGFHHPILMRAGALKVNVRNYLKNDVIASLIWMLIIGGLGYFSSASFLLVRRYVKFAEISLLLVLVVVFGILHYISSRSQRTKRPACRSKPPATSRSTLVAAWLA